MNYVDLQVNGYLGVDFNSDQLTDDAMHEVCTRLREHGAARFLPTVITDSVELMEARLQHLVRLRDADPVVADIVGGFHIEGPFLNPTPGYIGAHSIAATQPANVDDMQRLLDAAGGLTRVVTLAPEHDDGCRVTRMLADQGICVSAGQPSGRYVISTSATHWAIIASPPPTASTPSPVFALMPI